MDNDHIPAAVKSLALGFAEEWQELQELTGGTVAAGAQKAATEFAILAVAHADMLMPNKINTAISLNTP